MSQPQEKKLLIVTDSGEPALLPAFLFLLLRIRQSVIISPYVIRDMKSPAIAGEMKSVIITTF